jgi:hypothetical protein
MSATNKRRRCGTCTACCTADDPSACASCRAGAARTKGCDGFECVWLMGLGTPADRPDRLGVVFALARNQESGQLGILARELRPGACRSDSGKQLIGGIAKRLPVLVAEHAVIAPGLAATFVSVVEPAAPPITRPSRGHGRLAERVERRRGRR